MGWLRPLPPAMAAAEGAALPASLSLESDDPAEGTEEEVDGGVCKKILISIVGIGSHRNCLVAYREQPGAGVETRRGWISASLPHRGTAGATAVKKLIQ